MRAILTFLSIAAATLLLSACETTPTGQKPGDSGTPATSPTPQQPTVSPVDVTGKPSASGINPLKDPNNILSKRSVYFDFDKFEVKDEYRPVVEAHAKYLKDNPGAKMLIQGNADERGSREYNVGLGQRRSDAVKSMLKLLGVRETQIEAVSLGEEKPSCSERTEDCWAKNRRDDMLYTGEY
jgi:peptidoglycan-associated lipoprotein